MKEPIKLENWSVTIHPNYSPYTAPELCQPSLAGWVSNHPKLGEGHIITSAIAKVEGRKITTRSGSVYILGCVSKTYRKWLKLNRPNWNWKEPITIVD